MFSRSRMKKKCTAKTDFTKKKRMTRIFFQKQNKKKNDIFELLSETKRIF